MGVLGRGNPLKGLTPIVSYKLCRTPKSQRMTRLIEQTQIQNLPCIAAESTGMWISNPWDGSECKCCQCPGCSGRCALLWASFVKSFMRSTKHFADLPNLSPQSSNHYTDGGGEKTSNFYCVRSFDFLLITSYYKSAIGSCIHLLLGVEKYTLLLDSNSGAKNITGSKGTAIYPKQNLNKPVSLPGPFVYFSCGHPCLSRVRGWIYHQHRLSQLSSLWISLSFSIPMPGTKSTQGPFSKGSSTSRGNAALVCAEETLFSFLEREVLMPQLFFLLFLTKPNQEQCQKNLLCRNTHS